MRKFNLTFMSDPVWSRVMAMSLGLFFVFFSDAILSYWVPIFTQDSLGGALLMGLAMSFSSVVGLIADLIFPEILKGTSVRRLIVLAVLSSVTFAGVLLSATWWPLTAIILVAMGFWGVYYEFLGFANQQFVSETVPARQRSGAWAVMGTFRSLAYFLGPLVAGLLLKSGNRTLLLVAIGMTLLGYLIFVLMKMRDKKVEVELEEINVFRELSHWWVLLKHVWPIVTISLTLGLVDAAFWTTGTVWSEALSEKSWWGSLFLPLYIMPSLFMGFVVLKWGIYKHKKRWAEKFMLVGALVLTALGLSEVLWWQLSVVFVSSILLSVSYPLMDAVYTDVVTRMGRERKHLIGLSSSTFSLAYIVGPVLWGAVSQMVGERLTFVTAGTMMGLVAGVLLITTPLKLKLPQVEISSWHEAG